MSAGDASRGVTPVDAADFNAAFRGGVYGDGPATTPDLFVRHVACNEIDLARSPRFVHDGELAGIALLAFRGERAWLGGFGVVPSLRGRGFARRYLDRTLALAREAGATSVELEVLVANAPAIALYARAGFAVEDELVVWSRVPVADPPPALPDRATGTVELDAIVRRPAACWQREPRTFAAFAPCRSIVVGPQPLPRAYAVFAREPERTVLFDAGADGAASARALLDGLAALAPAESLRLLNEPAHGPLHDALAGNARWSETARQWRMRLELPPA